MKTATDERKKLNARPQRKTSQRKRKLGQRIVTNDRSRTAVTGDAVGEAVWRTSSAKRRGCGVGRTPNTHSHDGAKRVRNNTHTHANVRRSPVICRAATEVRCAAVVAVVWSRAGRRRRRRRNGRAHVPTTVAPPSATIQSSPDGGNKVGGKPMPRRCAVLRGTTFLPDERTNDVWRGEWNWGGGKKCSSHLYTIYRPLMLLPRRRLLRLFLKRPNTLFAWP